MNNDIEKIQKVIEDYFRGTFEADEKRIKRAFHPDAKITGNIDGNYIEITLAKFIERVKSLSSAHDKDQVQPYDKRILAIQLHGDLAAVTAYVLVDTNYFTDYLTLLKIDNRWVIRQKSFTNA